MSLRTSGRRCAHPRALAFLLSLSSLLALGSCVDQPTSPTPPDVRAIAAIASTAGASASVPVQVPASMRSWPFDSPRSLRVPAGYGVAVLARVGGARFLAVAPDGDVLVSSPGAGAVYRVRAGANGADASVSVWASGLRNPHDIVVHALDGVTWIYVAESHQIDRFQWNGDGSPGVRQVVVAGLPDNSSPELQGQYGHQLKNIALSGSRLYVSIASPSNADPSDLDRTPKGGSIYEYDAGGGGGRLFATGLRNAEGLAFVPGGSTLWAAVNNRDNVAVPFHGDVDGDGVDDYGRVVPQYVDDHPPDELTRVRDGGNYGWPFCNPNPDTPSRWDDMPFDRDVQNNADGSRLDCDAIDRISKGIPAHSAPLGLTFLLGTNAPAEYRDGLVIAYHGSWNRTQRTGYKIVHFPWDAGAQRAGAESELVGGWADGEVWGRPVDVAVAPDGALLISDDHSGTIYRLTPGAATPPPAAVGQALVGAASGRCFEVFGASTAPGAPLGIWDCHGGANQRWTRPTTGEAGEVRVYGALCLDGAGGAPTSAVTIAACSGAASQRWTYTSAGELRDANGRCVDVWGDVRTNGAGVLLWDCHGGDNQRWGVDGPPPSGGPAVLLGSGGSAKCLEVAGGTEHAAPGLPLGIWQCHGGANQRWSLPAVGGTGEVRAYGLCLDAWGATGADGDALVIWPCHGGANQQWTRTAAGELRGHTGKCVDLWLAEPLDGRAVKLYTCHGGENQRWTAR